ncbi:MAG: type II toxin-antitoxin system RelE/ParE family toxin [Spirochaetia bacterium]|nr:type II toxin-antitoxin system RelE/ParE family toxin [Spirochaetia bacterium]
MFSRCQEQRITVSTWLRFAPPQLTPLGRQLRVLAEHREGLYSIRINSQWRVCFQWQNGNALNVEIVDYH